MEAAETYAREMNSRITANVHYYVRNKEPEPGAVKKRAAQPELDARAHAETTPRNEAAEKQNEIPGRQIIAELETVTEMQARVIKIMATRLAELGDTVTGRDEIAQADKAYRDAIGGDEWPDWAEQGGEDDGEPYHTGGA